MSIGIRVKRSFFIFIFFLVAGTTSFQGNVVFAQDLPTFFNMSKNVAGLVREGNLQIGLVSDREVISPGDTFTLGVKMEHDSGWHTYWSNPGDTGLPTKITHNFSIANGLWRVGPIQWPTPKKFLIGTLANYGYENSLLLLQDISMPDDLVTDSVRIDVNIAWLICKDVCIPGNKTLSIRLPVSEDLEAGRSSDFWSIDEVRKNNPKEDTAFSERLFWSHSEDYKKLYIYSFSEPLNKRPEFFPLKKGLIIPSASQSFIKFRDVANKDIGWRLESKLYTEIPEVEKLGIDSLNGLLKFSDGSSKYIKLDYRDFDEGNVEVIELAGTVGENKKNADESYSETNIGFLLSITFAFFGGLILNLMPCVFPVIGIKILSLIKTSNNGFQSTISTMGFSLGVLTFMLLFAVTFMLLRNSGASIGWGFQLQNSSFVLCLVFLFFLLALNLFGFFEFATSSVSLASYDRFSGFLGNFLSGALTVVVATPCTAPFMGSALGYAISTSNTELILVFFALGIGISFPYVVLASNPRLIGFLPKPGKWMQLLREFLGFPMLISAGWLLLVYIELEGNESILQIFFILILVAIFFWHKKHFPKKSKTSFNILERINVVRLLLIVTIAITTHNVFNSHSRKSFDILSKGNKKDEVVSITKQQNEWKNWEIGLPEKFLQKGDTVLLDFTATWCITCQVNKVRVLEDEQIINLFTEKNIILIRADWTKQNKEIENEIKKYGRVGVPLNILLRPGQAPYIFSEWLDKEEIVNLLID